MFQKMGMGLFGQDCIAFYIVPNCLRNNFALFDIDRIILTCQNNSKSYSLQTDRRTNPNYRKASLLKGF